MIETLSDNTYVASVSTADSFTFSLRPVDLVRYDVCAPWKKLKTYMMTEHNAALIGKEHDASARRMHCFVDTLSGIYTTTSDQIVLSLDGIGSNRETFADKFRDLSTHMIPQFLTYEIDPAVALSQQLLYGKRVVTYTGAMVKEKFGYGCDGARPSIPSGIEYLITNRINSSGVSNELITTHCCDNVVGLNLDYCGGVLGGLDFEASKRTLVNLLARLPRLVVLCLTFGKRQRPGLKYDFEKYAPVPYSPPIPSSVASVWVSGGSNYVPETDKGGARRNGLVQRVDFLGDKMPFQKRVPQNQNLCRSPRARCSAEDAKKMRPALLDSSPAYQGGPPRQAA